MRILWCNWGRGHVFCGTISFSEHIECSGFMEYYVFLCVDFPLWFLSHRRQFLSSCQDRRQPLVTYDTSN